MRFIDILETIKKRRSIHQFQTKEVPESVLEEIFSYGSWAPTHYMKEPWNIKIYQKAGKQLLVDAIIRSYQRLGMLRSDQTEKTRRSIQAMKNFLIHIPHHALIYFPITSDPVRYEEDYAAVCAFIQNSQLAAWSFNVGMLWTITPYMHDPEFAREVELDADEMKIAAVMQIGYPEKINKPKERTPIVNKMEFITK